MQTRFFVVLLAVGFAASLHAQRPRFGGFGGGGGLTVYEDPNFAGDNMTFRDDVANFQSVGLNDRISSLRVGRGEFWEVCEHANYLGRCRVVTGDESNLRDSGWNDRISSARRIRNGLLLYSDTRFNGEVRAFTGEIANLQSVDFNDKARSLQIIGRDPWEICVDANFIQCVTVTRDTFDLNQMSMSRRISSLRPAGGR